MPNKNRKYEAYVGHLLILFYPSRTESDLKIDNSYTKKLAAPYLIDIVNGKRSVIEAYCESVDEVLLRYNTVMINKDERIEENSFVSNDILDDNSTENEGVDCMDQSGIINLDITGPLLLQNYEEINKSILSFNVKQRQIFGYILTLAKEKVKQKSSIKLKEVKLFNPFMSGSSGV